MTRADLNRKLREFEAHCRTLGLPVTYQRLAIFKALLQLAKHATPDDVFQVVRRAYPSISLATVYKTLERLEGAGLIAKPNLLHETALYEARVAHHHHVVCTACLRLEDVDPGDLRVPRPRDLDAGFEIHGWSITFRGLCGACQMRQNVASEAVSASRGP